MVFVKKICPPERRKAIIAVTAHPSAPTLSINDKHESFQLRISLSIAESTRPGEAITINTNGSVFQPSNPEGDLDRLAQGTVGLKSTSDPNRRINLGHFIIHRGRPDPSLSADLKERDNTHLLTIPATGEVEISHDLPLDRIFKYEDRLKPEDVVGETWRLGLSDGNVGTTWWCWGDLEGDLKEKRLSAWHEGMRPERNPKPEGLGEEWVLGCDPVELVFEDRTDDATFRFVGGEEEH